MDKRSTICPRSSYPYYIVRILYKIGHFFLETQYQVVLKTPITKCTILAHLSYTRE